MKDTFGRPDAFLGHFRAVCGDFIHFRRDGLPVHCLQPRVSISREPTRGVPDSTRAGRVNVGIAAGAGRRGPGSQLRSLRNLRRCSGTSRASGKSGMR